MYNLMYNMYYQVFFFDKRVEEKIDFGASMTILTVQMPEMMNYSMEIGVGKVFFLPMSKSAAIIVVRN